MQKSLSAREINKRHEWLVVKEAREEGRWVKAINRTLQRSFAVLQTAKTLGIMRRAEPSFSFFVLAIKCADIVKHVSRRVLGKYSAPLMIRAWDSKGPLAHYSLTSQGLFIDTRSQWGMAFLLDCSWGLAYSGLRQLFLFANDKFWVFSKGIRKPVRCSCVLWYQCYAWCIFASFWIAILDYFLLWWNGNVFHKLYSHSVLPFYVDIYSLISLIWPHHYVCLNIT